MGIVKKHVFKKYTQDTDNDPVEDYLKGAILGPFTLGKSKIGPKNVTGGGGMRSGQRTKTDNYKFLNNLAKAWKNILRVMAKSGRTPTDEQFKTWLQNVADDAERYPWHKEYAAVDPDRARKLLRQRGLRTPPNR